MSVQLPNDVRAESALLRSLMTYGDTFPVVRDRLQADEFYADHHRLIYEAIDECYALGHEIEVFTVIDRLKAHGLLEKAGGYNYVSGLMVESSLNGVHHAETYASMIKLAAWRRRALLFAQNVARLAHSAETNINDIHRQILDGANKLGGGVMKGARTSRQMADAFMDDVLDAIQNDRKGRMWRTGFELLDKLLYPSYGPGTFTIFGAYTNQGKTQVALQLAIEAARQGPVLYVTLESTPETIFNRQVAVVCGLSATQIAERDLSGEEAGMALGAAGELGNLPLEHESLETLEDIEAYVADMSIRFDFAPGMIFIDDIDSLADMQRGENEWAKLRKVSTGLLRLGLRTGWGVVGLKQFLMPTTAKEVKNNQCLYDLLCPTIMSVEGGRAIAQKGGNVVGMLSADWIRSKVYKDFYHDDLRPGYVYFYKLKARDGRSSNVTEVPLRFNADVPRFENAGGLRP